MIFFSRSSFPFLFFPHNLGWKMNRFLHVLHKHAFIRQEKIIAQAWSEFYYPWKELISIVLRKYRLRLCPKQQEHAVCGTTRLHTVNIKKHTMLQICSSVAKPATRISKKNAREKRSTKHAKKSARQHKSKPAPLKQNFGYWPGLHAAQVGLLLLQHAIRTPGNTAEVRISPYAYCQIQALWIPGSVFSHTN